MHYQTPSRFVLYIYHIKMIDDQYLWDVREQYLLWLFKSSTVSVHFFSWYRIAFDVWLF
jgi:hypothetical protein